MRAPIAPLALALLLAALAGCLHPAENVLPGTYQALGFDGLTWPKLPGAKLTILAYSSYGTAFKEHEKAFENLTGADVVLLTAEDAGKVLERAAAERGNPTFDVVYGIDNVLLERAVASGVFEPYRPVLHSRIDPAYLLRDDWPATPINHGYIAVNVDPRANLSVANLDDVRAHAAQFVTEDPRTSTPGLGFLIATVAAYGEDDGYDYLAYWRDLLHGGVTVVADWDQAYVHRFSGGYGQFEPGALADKALVTSYTTSPAYEMYYGYDRLNGNVLAPGATFHQVQTVGIAKGTRNAAVAQAWVEFTLTDAFQATIGATEAIYPVVKTPDVTLATSAVFAGHDPAPGSFTPAGFTPAQLGAGVERWLRDWTDVYERARA